MPAPGIQVKQEPIPAHRPRVRPEEFPDADQVHSHVLRHAHRSRRHAQRRGGRAGRHHRRRHSVDLELGQREQHRGVLVRHQRVQHRQRDHELERQQQPAPRHRHEHVPAEGRPDGATRPGVGEARIRVRATTATARPARLPGSQLWVGIGCSDPYGNQQNGVQVDLAPKSEINAATGYFPIPYNGTPAIPPTTGRRLQARHVDLDPAAQRGRDLLHRGPLRRARATSAQNFNNASYRRVNVTPNGASYNISFIGREPDAAAEGRHPGVEGLRSERRDHVRRRPERWPLHHGIPRDRQRERHDALRVRDPQPVLGPLAARTVDRDAGGANVTNVGFKDVDYHSNEPGNYSLTDWTPTVAPGSVSWATRHVRDEPGGERAPLGHDVQLLVRLEPAAGTRDLHAVQAGHADDDGRSRRRSRRSRSRSRADAPATMEPDQAARRDGERHEPRAASPTPSSGLLYAAVDNGPFTSSPLTYVGGSSFTGSLPGDALLPHGALVREPRAARRRRSDHHPAGAPGVDLLDRSPSRPCSGRSSRTTARPRRRAGPSRTAPVSPTAHGTPRPACRIGGGDRGDPATAYGGSGQVLPHGQRRRRLGRRRRRDAPRHAGVQPDGLLRCAHPRPHLVRQRVLGAARPT